MSKADFWVLLEMVLDGVAITDAAGQCLDANQNLVRMLGYGREELIVLNISDIVAPAANRWIKSAMIGEVARSGLHREWQMLRKDDSVFAADISAAPMANGNLLVIFRDMTKENDSKLEMEAVEQQLRSLVSRCHKVREEEGRRIARELHDNLGQQLTALKMQFSGLEEKMTGITPELSGHLAQMNEGVDHMIEVVQHISGEVRLAHLDVLGLSAAVEWQSKEFSRRSAILARITRLDEAKGLPDEHSTAFFRILQEGLTNVARHSGATEVEISLEIQPSQTILVVRDNGRGITRAQLDGKGSIGLIGIRERARIVGGIAEITGKPGVGTTVTVTIPHFLTRISSQQALEA